jgi:hypothetical protein
MRRSPITDAPCYDLSVRIGEAGVVRRQKLLGTRKASHARAPPARPGKDETDVDLRPQALSISDMKQLRTQKARRFEL